MRLVGIGVALALAGTLPGASATAQAPVSTQPLAPGEVLLELNSTGSVINRADVALFSIRANGEGDTAEEARRAADTEAARIAGIARNAGVAPADIRIMPARAMPSYMTTDMMPADNSMAVDMNAAESMSDPEAVAPPRRSQAMADVVIRARDMARLQPMLRLVEEAGGMASDTPTYALLDPDAARRDARTRALATARADAEAYATALNLRVVRVVRVTERLGFDFISMMMNERAMRRQSEANEGHNPDIETSVTIGVDFALAPR